MIQEVNHQPVKNAAEFEAAMSKSEKSGALLLVNRGGTTVFVNAHHSIGVRAIELFGTKEQKERWLPPACC